jgi:hypothetical protein
MKSLYRVLVILLMMLAALFLASCSGGAPGCPQASFGTSTACGPSGQSGFGGGGGGGGGSGGSSSVSAYVYAVDQGGTIDGYAVNGSAGTFAAISGYTAPVIATNNGGVGMVVAQKQYLYAGLASVDELYGYTIAANGSLTPITGTPLLAPYLSFYGSGVGQANMITNPTGTLLFISDTLQSEIYAYQIGTGGALTAVTGSPFACPAGFTPMNLGTDGLGLYLYAVNGDFTTHTGTAIAAFTISTAGVLTPVPGSPFIFPMWQVKGEPTGQFLIGTSGNTASVSGVDDDNLYVFSITQSGSNAGAITAASGSPFVTTYSPFSIAVQSNVGGTFVYSMSFNDTATGFNPIEGYTISTTSGALTVDTGSPFSGVGDGSWAQFDQSGVLLMAYASYLNPQTGVITTQLSPIDVGSGGALTQPIPTSQITTPGFWVVTDTQ